MLKEIYEQPRSVRDTTLGRVSQETGQVFLDEMEITEAEFKAARTVNIAACGTSWHAAQAGSFDRAHGALQLKSIAPANGGIATHHYSRHPDHADHPVGRNRGHHRG
jgi:hypothetical protein